MNVERFVREDDVQPTCTCAAKKCGPHRCRASRWWRAAFLVMFAWNIVLLSWLLGDRDIYVAEAVQRWENQVVDEATEQFDRQAARIQASWDAEMAPLKQQLWAYETLPPRSGRALAPAY